MTKVIAFYLPQFHSIPENDEWWGEGFTEWTNVKKATPLFKNHYQPRIPLDSNYYNLLDADTIRWQADLSREYGIFGFCIYHYWFDGHLLLEKPLELIRDTEDIAINYCICWANEDWTNAWSSDDNKTLIAQTYGGEELWRKHFIYLESFFRDQRYIKVDGKPLLVIYRPELIGKLNQMLDYWEKMAVDCGFAGIAYAYQQLDFALMRNHDESRFSYAIEYQPRYGRNDCESSRKSSVLTNRAKTCIKRQMIKRFHWNPNVSKLKNAKGPRTYDYEEIWNAILERKPASEKCIPGAFVDWDNTPRRHKAGSVFVGASPQKFKHFMKRQLEHARKDYSSEFLFLFAWNEWAEGGYMEPDMKYGYGYLEALKQALQESGQFPECC